MKTNDPIRRPSGEPAPRVSPERDGPSRVELLLVGRDLLRGQIADTNSKYISNFVAERGGNVQRITIVDDDMAAVSGALRESLERSPHLVITAGGLGPASDDRTAGAVAEALSAPLSANAQAKAFVEAAYQRLYRGKLVHTAGLNAVREKLFHLPVGSEPVPNTVGAAPGVVCRLPGGTGILCLPGKPEELRAVLREAAKTIKELTPVRHIARREIESPTADESSLRPMLDRLTEEFPSLWISSRPVGAGRRDARVVVLLEASGATPEDAGAAVGGAVRRLLALASGSA